MIVGILAIVIGFKIINKLSKRFIEFAEKRNMYMTLVRAREMGILHRYV